MHLQTFQGVLLQKPGLPSLGLPTLTLLRSPYFQGSNPPTPRLIQRRHTPAVTDLGGCQGGREHGEQGQVWDWQVGLGSASPQNFRKTPHPKPLRQTL